jgi:methylated-DNA-[protein]-cysteine S-methyltransferase
MTAPLLAATHSTPAGPFTFVAGADGVCAAGFTADLALVAALRGAPHRQADIHVVADAGDPSKAVLAWAEGDVDAPLSIDVAMEGTDFQRAVWAALRTIPPGHPLSYTGLAAAAGRPAAVRAAGRGCATNRVSLFVPCHRVVPASGGVGGFLWGPAVKEALLTHEAGRPVGAASASGALPLPFRP